MILKIIFTLLNGMISVLPLNNSVTRNCSADSVFIMYLFRCVFLVADKRLIGSSRFFFRINCRLITKLLILLCSFSLYSPRSVLSPQHISFPSLHALIRWPGLCIPCAIPRYHQREHPTRRLCHIAHPRVRARIVPTHGLRDFAHTFVWCHTFVRCSSGVGKGEYGLCNTPRFRIRPV